jgi:hypothetical protein
MAERPTGTLAGSVAPRRCRRRRLLWLAALVVVAAIGVAVYSELTVARLFTPSRSMMIGTWRSPSGAVLTLKSNGIFTARALPADFGASPIGSMPSSGDGVWHIGPVPTEPPGVVFNFSKKLWVELFVEHVGSTVVMYFDKGDPDEGATGQYQFTRMMRRVGG